MNLKQLFCFLLFSVFLLLSSLHAQCLDNKTMLTKYYDNMDELDIKQIEKEKIEQGLKYYSASFETQDDCTVYTDESQETYQVQIYSHKNPTIIYKWYYKTGELRSKKTAYWSIGNTWGDVIRYDKEGNIISQNNPTSNFTFTLAMLIEKVRKEYEIDIWDNSNKMSVTFQYDDKHPTYRLEFGYGVDYGGDINGKPRYGETIIDAQTGKILKVAGKKRYELIDPPADQEEVTQATPKNRWSPLLDDDSPLI